MAKESRESDHTCDIKSANNPLTGCPDPGHIMTTLA
jgi:hypothetical protein